MPPQLTVENHGPLIVRTNYWETEWADRGYVLLSPNAGAFRLLLPRGHEQAINDMHTAKGCAVSFGPWSIAGDEVGSMFEVLFDDESTDPFSIHISPDQVIPRPAAADVAGEWTLSVWTAPRRQRDRPRMALQRPCRYRLSRQIPDMRPWQET